MDNPKPALMRFEGPMYSDGSGPQISVEYQGHSISPFTSVKSGGGAVPNVRIRSIGEGDVAVLLPNVPWLIETLRRIMQEAS